MSKSISWSIGLTFVALAAVAIYTRWASADGPANPDGFTLTSPAFTDGGALPSEFTCDGAKASPPLTWSNAPAGTKSFAITMHHLPGDGDKHVYMVIYNIGPDVKSLAKNSKDVGVFGINTVNGQQEYTPPCSQGPGPRKYILTAYALSAAPKIDGPASAVTMDMFLTAIKDTTLAKAQMSVTYDGTGKTPDDNANAAPPDANDGGGPDGPPPGDRGARRPPGGPEGRALAGLNLADDQKAKIDPIMKDFRDKQDKLRDDLLKQMKDVLTPDQYEQYEKSFRRPPPPPPPEDNGDNPGPPQTAAPAAAPAENAAAIPAPDGAGVAVIFTGGHDTDHRDGGRPVILIASALNVPSDVFRKTFTHVTPARGEEPQEDQVRKNKQALLDGLTPYGVTDDRLNEVSNFYRYASFKGEMWRTTPATATATIKNGVVTSITITNPGAGYSSPPKVSVPGVSNFNPTVIVSYTTDFKTNGSIKEIKLTPDAPSTQQSK